MGVLFWGGVYRWALWVWDSPKVMGGEEKSPTYSSLALLQGPDHPPSLHSPYPGTSPHVVTNVSVVPLPKGANVSWEPGFDGGYLQRFSVWYTPL